jgi:hypothetical protein
MPSPRGTNHARLFLVTNPRAAYDAMPDDKKAELIEFLRGLLSEEDHKRAVQLISDPDAAMDSPEPFKGMPQPGGGKFGQDARYRRPMTAAQEADFNKRFPNAARIGTSF